MEKWCLPHLRGVMGMSFSRSHPKGPTTREDRLYATVSSKDFSTVVEKLQRADVTVWKDNRSEGDSFYFLDPDGHKLEIHVGSLIERLAHCQKAPYENMVFYD